MKPQRWRCFWLFLLTCGLSYLAASPIFAQTKSNSKGLEVYTSGRKTADLPSGTNDFAPGDGVRVKVWRDISVADQGGVQNLGLNDDFVIDSRGYVSLPIIGEIRAVGHTRRNLARAIEDSLSIRAVRVMCSPLIRVTLLGAVNKPGSYLIEPKESLWGLINDAGGPSNNADVRKIYVERSGKVIVKNLLQGFEQAHALEQIGVRSGDQIYVPGRSGFNFRTVVDYATLTASFVVLYFQLKDRTR
ncbi:MAG: polysaccharide biosynthesis/export family protein [bacterium]